MIAGNGESTQPFLGRLREKSFHHSRRTMIQIPGYSVTEPIYTGIKTLVYRALTDDHKPVIIKLTRSEYPSFNELIQFRNQYTIAKNLALPGIIKPYALEPYRNGYVLIMEDFGGISLQNYTTKHATSLQQFLNIAIQITSTLDELHRHHIIHKDIKPSNILINSQLEVKLIDFSIASLLPRETQQHCTPKVLEGTLAYISPEQTGRMNRSVDYRTDLLLVIRIWINCLWHNGNIEIGYQFGEIALQLFDRNNIKQLKSRMFMIFYSFISHWKNHINTTIEPLLSAYYSGLETGEVDYAGYSINLYSLHLYITGKNLLYTISEISKYSICLEKFQQKQILNHQIFLKQAVLNLIGDSNNPCYLIGSAYDEQLMLPILQENNDRTAIFAIYNNKLFICYLFGNYDLAKENMLHAEKYLDAGVGLVHIPLFYFYSSLVHLAIYSNVPMAERRNIRAQVKNNQKKMKKWAKYAPMNHLHKWHLVEAELARVSGKNSQAMEHYDRAINLAYTNEYTQEQAIANELAAKFYLEWGKQNIAQIYLTQAYYCYARWGAKAKVEDLEKRYPELLAPILQREQTSLNAHSTITTSGITSDVESSGPSQALDLTAVIKASRILSGEIQLEQLLSTLMQIVMQIAGASKCALILHQDNNLQVAVTALANSTSDTPIATITSTPLEYSSDVPITLINYVYRTKETLVIDDVLAPQASLPIDSDRYILHTLPKSLLCIPMINQGKVQGILMLENNLTTGAFTSDRVEILKLITIQAAISLENALLYNNLAQANQRLEDANYSLEQKVTSENLHYR